jgi:hypothetical protein
LTFSLSSKLEKVPVVRSIPRVFRATAFRTGSLAKHVISSLQIKHLKSSSYSFIISVPPVTSRYVRHVRSTIAPVARSATARVRSTVPPMVRSTPLPIRSAVTPIGRSVPKLFSRSSLRITNVPSVESTLAAGRRLKFRIVPRLGAFVKSFKRTPVSPKITTLVENLGVIPSAEIKYPTKNLSGFPYRFVRTLDDFSNLPMWFTLPILFVLSVVLGIVVAVLV